MQGDFEEVPIRPASAEPAPPAPGSVPGHNQPPPDSLDTLKAKLVADNAPMIAKVAEWEQSVARVPAEITTAEDATKAADFYKILNAGLTRLDERYEEAKKPVRERANLIDGFFRTYRQQIDGWKRLLLSRVDGYQARLRAEAARKAAAEAEARRAEAERLRQEADKAAEAGRVGEATAVAAIAQEQQTKSEKASVVAAAPPPSASTVQSNFGGGIGSRTVWTFEVIDKKMMPVDYLEPNEALIKAKVSTENKAKRLENGKEYTDIIPGVKIFQKTSASGR